MRDLAKKICQYNGQRGNEKQVDTCIRQFQGSMMKMKQFAKGRVDLRRKCEMCLEQMTQEEHDYCDICGKCLDQE